MELFDFDPAKSARNKERHGIDLAWAQRLWARTHAIIEAKNVLGERRKLILAKVEGRCYVAVFTMRGDSIRLISCHRADRRFERIYEQKVHEEN